GKFIGRHLVRSKKGVLVLGSSRAADVRLLGDDVNPVHAYIEYSDGTWHVSDAGTEHGTWLQKAPIVREAINEASTIVIGGHTLKLIPHVTEKELFTQDRMKEASSGIGQTYQQVVIRQGDITLRSELGNAQAPYEFNYQGQI